MSRLVALMLLTTFAFGPRTVHAQEESGYTDHPPRTQQDIIRDRENACKGLKGQAHSECVANYVGPKRDHAGGGGWKRPAHPPRSEGRA
jgi:hypothetical protein